MKEDDSKMLPATMEPKIKLEPPSSFESFSIPTKSYERRHHVQTLKDVDTSIKFVDDKKPTILPKIQPRNSIFVSLT